MPPENIEFEDSGASFGDIAGAWFKPDASVDVWLQIVSNTSTKIYAAGNFADSAVSSDNYDTYWEPYTTGGQWTSNPSNTGGTSGYTTLTDSAANFGNYLVGWQLQLNVESPQTLTVTEVPSATTIRVHGDATNLAATDDFYRLFAPPGTQSSANGAVWVDQLTNIRYPGDHRHLWSGLPGDPPITGVVASPNSTINMYGVQTGDNKYWIYRNGKRIWAPDTARAYAERDESIAAATSGFTTPTNPVDPCATVLTGREQAEIVSASGSNTDYCRLISTLIKRVIERTQDQKAVTGQQSVDIAACLGKMRSVFESGGACHNNRPHEKKPDPHYSRPGPHATRTDKEWDQTDRYNGVKTLDERTADRKRQEEIELWGKLAEADREKRNAAAQEAAAIQIAERLRRKRGLPPIAVARPHPDSYCMSYHQGCIAMAMKRNGEIMTTRLMIDTYKELVDMVKGRLHPYDEVACAGCIGGLTRGLLGAEDTVLCPQCLAAAAAEAGGDLAGQELAKKILKEAGSPINPDDCCVKWSK